MSASCNPSLTSVAPGTDVASCASSFSSELIADASETSSVYPRFITFQCSSCSTISVFYILIEIYHPDTFAVVWLLLGLLTALLCTYNMWRDITHARVRPFRFAL